jgi:serine O-acetyltransferase
MFKNITIIKNNDPAAKSYLEIILCYPGLHALWFHSLANLLYKFKFPILPRAINYISRLITGIDIHPGAKISSGVMIDHGMGVVIGETAVIEEGCLIYQGVTLGGTGKEKGKRHPTLGKNVVVGAGAAVLGNITIGENTRIGAGSVVMRNIPPNSTVVGIPGRVVKSTQIMDDEGKLDHNQLPDPVARVFSILLEKIETQQKMILDISKSKTIKEPNKSDNDDEINEFIYGDGI